MHLQPRHYQDVVLERSVALMCGYPLCARPLPRHDKARGGMYKIDMVNKCVLDNVEIKVRVAYCLHSPRTEIWPMHGAVFVYHSSVGFGFLWVSSVWFHWGLLLSSSLSLLLMSLLWLFGYCNRNIAAKVVTRPRCILSISWTTVRLAHSGVLERLHYSITLASGKRLAGKL